MSKDFNRVADEWSKNDDDNKFRFELEVVRYVTSSLCSYILFTLNCIKVPIRCWVDRIWSHTGIVRKKAMAATSLPLDFNRCNPLTNVNKIGYFCRRLERWTGFKLNRSTLVFFWHQVVCEIKFDFTSNSFDHIPEKRFTNRWRRQLSI